MYVGVEEKMEAASPTPQLKPCWDSDDDEDDATDDEEEERLQAAGGGVAMLTSPVNKLSKGSAHRPPPLPLPLPEADGSKEKRPL